MILELDEMVLFCMVYMKKLKRMHMNKFWFKKYDKSLTNVRKGKTMEKRFPS